MRASDAVRADGQTGPLRDEQPVGREVLTREDYNQAITRHFARAKVDFLEWVKFLDLEAFRQVALKRFDDGAKQYGANVDLLSREWWFESDEEAVDGLAYLIFETVKESRGL